MAQTTPSIVTQQLIGSFRDLQQLAGHHMLLAFQVLLQLDCAVRGSANCKMTKKMMKIYKKYQNVGKQLQNNGRCASNLLPALAIWIVKTCAEQAVTFQSPVTSLPITSDSFTSLTFGTWKLHIQEFHALFRFK